MPTTTIDGLKVLIKTIKGSRHKDFKRVTDLAKEYHALISGEGVDELLRRYVQRESPTDFKYRKDITEAITPAVAEKIMSPFTKVGRVDNVLKRRSFKNDEDLLRLNKLELTMKNFHGDEDVDAYMSTNFVNNSFTDPNAFIVVDFEAFDARSGQVPQPFPREIPSDDALNFKYRNNVLQWLVVQVPFNFIRVDGSKKTIVEAKKYFIYLKDVIIELKPVNSENKLLTSEVALDESGNIVDLQVFKIEDQAHQLTLFKPEAGQVQAIRIGYKKDLVTKSRTFVSPLHPALARFRKTLKAVSELDLTATLHAHPHKYQYVESCEGSDKQPCNNGRKLNGDVCGACNGTGNKVMTSAMDAVTVNIPRDKDEMFDLAKMSHFESPPIDLLKWQEEYSMTLEAQAVKDVFVSETFNRNPQQKTATEVNIDMQSVYDTLWPFANQWSKVWIKLNRLSAIFTTNNEGLDITHQFPQDFKMMNLVALLGLLDKSNEANAPDFVKTEIERDIARKLFLDNPRMLKIFDVKEQHRPFKGKSRDDVMFIIGSEASVIEDRVLWSNFESVFNELEQDQSATKIDFYDLGFDKRSELLKEKIEAFILKTKGITASGFDGGTGSDIDTPIDIEAAAKAKLKGTVGGVQGILAINKAVATGEMTEQAAEALLNVIYGFDPVVAQALIEKVIAPNV